MDSREIFRCDQCSKRFETLGRYNQHLKTHTKPFQCSDCTRGFALRSDLARHVQARHRLGIARHACVVTGCSFKASRKDNIRQHIRNCHPELPVGPPKLRLGCRRAKPHDVLTASPLDVPFNAHSASSTAGTHMLMQAASEGNIGLVQAILQSGVDISMQADDGSTALHCAAKADQTDMVCLLIESGARSDIVNSKGKGRTPLHEAILGHCTSTFNILVQRKVDITEHVLCAIIQTDQTQFFKTAWAPCGEQMFRLVGRELFEIAASSPETASMATLLLLPEITQQWIEKEGRSGVFRVIHKDKKAVLECLLRSGKLDVNTALATSYFTKRSLLYLAAARGKSETVGLLLGFETIDPNRGVYHGLSSPLGIAAWKGHVQVVEKLLQCSSIVLDGQRLRSGKTETYLHLACRQGHVGVIRLMLKAFDDRGLDTNIQDTTGSGLRMTPLQTAVRGGHTEAVALLLLRQDVDVNRTFGLSKLSLCQAAAQGGHGKLLSVLLGDGRVDRNDVRNSRQSLLSEAFLGAHWCLVEILFDYESVPLDITSQSLNLRTESSGKRVDILKRGLLELTSLPARNNTLWHRAAYTGSLSLAMLLLEHAQTYHSHAHPSVDVNHKDGDGRAPLHVAVESGKLGIIELLLHHKQIDVTLTTCGTKYMRARSAIEIIEQNHHKYWSYHQEERAYTVDLLLAHGARTASRDRADNANKVVLPPSVMGVEENVRHSFEQGEDLRRKDHASWASIVGIHDGGGGPGGGNVEDEHTVGDVVTVDVIDPMEEDPDSVFKEWMYFDDEEPSDNNSLEMWERDMSLE